MGWLREFMSQAGLRSYGELARVALAQPEWPDDVRIQPRSLEAILGRLDRHEELDWLTERPGIQQVLATVLQASVAEIRSILIESSSPRPKTDRLRIEDIRSARSIELALEPLPPGIPERVLLPASWTRCCWLGEPGAGFTLVAQWLAARGLAQTASIHQSDDAQFLANSGPPLFVEVAPEMLAGFVSSWTGFRPICVAVASPTRSTPLTGELSGFELVPTNPIRDDLEQIVDWILFRITGRSSRLRQSLLTWIHGGPLAWGIVRTLGDVIGLVGACIEGIVTPEHGTTKEELIRRWVNHRATELAREKHRDVIHLRQNLPEILIDIAQAALVDESRAVLAGRSIESWLELVPEQHRRGPDIDWLTTQLVSENLPMRKPDLERAAERLPPGAHRIVVALRELRILRPTGPTQFAIRPHFLGRLIQSVARDRVANSSPLFWGEALLRPVARAELLPAVELRALRQPDALAEDALEQIDLDNPALVCAFETSFVLLGLAILDGQEISEQLAASLLQEQAALLLVDVDSIPRARTTPRAPAGLPDLPGALYLAAWALSEHAQVRRRFSVPAALDPWRNSVLPDYWPQILDEVGDVMEVAISPRLPWFPAAVRLLDRLRQCVGAHAGPTPGPHALFLPGELLDAVDLGVLDWNQFEPVLFERKLLNQLLASIEPRHMTLDGLMRSIGEAWLAAGSPRSLHESWPQWPPGAIEHAPPELLAALLISTSAALPDSALSSLPQVAWLAWLDSRTNDLNDEGSERPWQHAPLEILDRALVDRAPTDDNLRNIVWRRHPEGAIRQIQRDRTLMPESAASWLRIAPLERAPLIAKFALDAAWVRSAELVTIELQRLMYRACSARVSDWPSAYECLNQLILERSRFESLSQK